MADVAALLAGLTAPDGVGSAWQEACALLAPCSLPPVAASASRLHWCVAAVSAAGLGPLLIGWLADRTRASLAAAVAPTFWAALDGSAAHADAEAVADAGGGPLSGEEDAAATGAALLWRFCGAATALRQWVEAAAPLHTLLAATDGREQLLQTARAELLAAAPKGYGQVAQRMYAAAFMCYHEMVRREDMLAADDTGKEAEGEGRPFKDVATEDLHALLAAFRQAQADLGELRLTSLFAPVFTHVLHEEIDRHVAAKCGGAFEETALEPMLDWLDVVPLGWLRLLYPPAPAHDPAAGTAMGPGADAGGDEGTDTLRQEWGPRLAFHLHQTLGALRIGELFDIIVDFPDSQAAVEDLRDCIARTDQRDALVTSLRTALQRRLLLSGASTTDILMQ